MWFFDYETHNLGRITTTGSVTWFQVPGGGEIVAGPDGNLWMTAFLGFGQQDWILRITPSGQVTKFPASANTPGEGSGPTGITVGPDGNLWFTESIARRIGRMTPQGHLTEFTVPGVDLSLGDIVTGPDGNLWFTESADDQYSIGRITPSGVLGGFPLTTDNRYLDPRSIVAGPDHDLWFGGLGEIDRMTTSGVVTRFKGVGASDPPNLAVGSDGNIWFNDTENNAIGRMDLNGHIHEFALPRQLSKPWGIASGPDGRIWFTESDTRQVGAIGLTVPEVKLSAKVVVFGQATQTVQVTDVGDGALHVDSIDVRGSDAAPFRISADGCSGKTVDVGALCQFQVSLSGISGGDFQGAEVEVVDNGTGSPQTVSLVAQLAPCRIPVVESDVLRGPSSAGFLGLPEGSFTKDPAGDPSAGTYSAGKWLPVPQSWVSPDGKRYVNASQVAGNNQLHVVDIATGADHALSLSGPYVPLAFAREGIYVHTGVTRFDPGLWLVNPDTGAMHEVLTSETVEAVGDGAEWIGAVNPQDPHPVRSVLGYGASPDELMRRDIATGQLTTWIYKPGEELSVVGISGGILLVSGRVGLAVPDVWIVSSPNEAAGLSISVLANILYTSGMVADRSGAWLGSLDGVYLWTARTGPVLVSDYGPSSVLGACA